MKLRTGFALSLITCAATDLYARKAAAAKAAATIVTPISIKMATGMAVPPSPGSLM